ncbi:MAG: hypothetical protein GXY86_03470, partial [Firmicutes bacterium]|nr:hypothetical protein [Bacillota bacterium]
NKPNPNIDFENSPVYVNNNLIDWEPAGFPRRCGVSAFGLSGTNSHILIEEASPSIYDQLDEDGEQILTLSACDPDALKRLVRSYYEFLNLRFKGRIGDFCYTANTGRGHYRYRLALIGRRLEEFKARLADLNDILVADENKGIYFGETTVEQRKTGRRSGSGGFGQIVTGSLSDICRSYIQGENIDWEGFYSSVAFRRISIPTYPFEKKQCWLELSKEKNNVKGPTEDNESIAVASDDLLFEEKVVVITGNAAFGYTETERSIGQIWGRVLGYDVMNIDDNFYELGGDSVNAIKITSLINHSLSLNLQVAELLEHQTIKELAAYIEQNTEKMNLGEVTEVKEAEDSLPNINNKIGDISFTRDSEGLNNILASQKMSSGEAPLVTVQKIHFQRNPTVINHWNTAIMLFRKEGFDEKVITKVFTELVKYHDALRIVFKTKENRIVQYTRDIQEKLFDLEVFSLNSEELVDVIDRETFGLCSGVDLGNGPLVRLGLFKTEIGDHLLISVNHLIMDSYSLYILLQDFTAGYLQTINHIDIKFPETTHSFIDWARDLNKYAYSEMLLAQIPYWKKIEEIRNTPLKKDYSLDLHYYRNVRNVTLFLSKDETEKLKRQANYLYKTGIPELVLTALGLTLKEWLGENKILIHNMSNGREGLNGIDLTRTIGYFSFGHPFVLDMTESSDLPYTVRLTRDKLRKVPNQGMGYEILAYMTPPERTKDLKFTLKSDLLFNFFGQINNLALGELFTISPIPLINHWSPEVERGFSIYVEGAILDGQLIIKIEYDEVEFREETISQVVKDYEKHLRKMMA